MIFRDFSVFSPPKIIGGLAPIWVRHGDANYIFPLSFGKSFMKIRSAVPENGCLVFMWRTEKKQKNNKKKQKNICKTYTHSCDA